MNQLPQSTCDEQQVSTHTHPLSLQRSPDRLSCSVASASSMRNGLTTFSDTTTKPSNDIRFHALGYPVRSMVPPPWLRASTPCSPLGPCHEHSKSNTSLPPPPRKAISMRLSDGSSSMSRRKETGSKATERALDAAAEDQSKKIQE